jgi:hypothetical protein
MPIENRRAPATSAAPRVARDSSARDRRDQRDDIAVIERRIHRYENFVLGPAHRAKTSSERGDSVLEVRAERTDRPDRRRKVHRFFAFACEIA